MYARTLRLAGATVVLLAAHAGLAYAQQPARVNWGPGPRSLPPGARMRVINGDPSRPGPFTIHLAMPSGYRIPPHYHPTDEHVMVRSGTFLYGTGDKRDRKTMKRLMKGQSGSLPANMHHYAEASGKTTVEIASEGPFVVNYVDPADDPQHGMAKQQGMAKKKN